LDKLEPKAKNCFEAIIAVIVKLSTKYIIDQERMVYHVPKE